MLYVVTITQLPFVMQQPSTDFDVCYCFQVLPDVNQLPLHVKFCSKMAFLSGMNPMTNSRNCTCPGSVCMYESVNAKYAGRQ